MKANDITGTTFGRLLVLHRGEKVKKQTRWVCICSCGAFKSIAYTSLVRGLTKSCGCLSRETTAKTLTTHGMAQSAEYSTWNRMKQRCNNPKNKDFKHYGGRGIKVCDEWANSFEAFYHDMGKRPSSKHTIGRIDNDGPYSVANCQWETMHQQTNNKRDNHIIIIDNELGTVRHWSRVYGIKPTTISQRIFAYGWDPIAAATTPIKRKRHN